MVRENHDLRAALTSRATQLKSMMYETNLPLAQSETHILPLIIGNATRCKQISDRLLEVHGIYLQPINYPTVPVGTERLRITPTPHHTLQQMKHLVVALKESLGVIGCNAMQAVE